jgi:hypothetical protein
MIAAWRLHKLVPMESVANPMLINEHQFCKTDNRLTAAESLPRHGSHDPISVAARGARA